MFINKIRFSNPKAKARERERERKKKGSWEIANFKALKPTTFPIHLCIERLMNLLQELTRLISNNPRNCSKLVRVNSYLSEVEWFEGRVFVRQIVCHFGHLNSGEITRVLCTYNTRIHVKPFQGSKVTIAQSWWWYDDWRTKDRYYDAEWVSFFFFFFYRGKGKKNFFLFQSYLFFIPATDTGSKYSWRSIIGTWMNKKISKT